MNEAPNKTQTHFCRFARQACKPLHYLMCPRGIANDVLQVDMLAKAKLLKSLEQNITHTEAFEMSMQDPWVLLVQV